MCAGLPPVGRSRAPDRQGPEGDRRSRRKSILVSILDPNREVDPAYVNYVALTNDGRAASGYIAAETAVSVTLKRADDASDTLLRRDIDQLQSSGMSIMPEGLEKELSQQDIADLITYLRNE